MGWFEILFTAGPLAILVIFVLIVRAARKAQAEGRPAGNRPRSGKAAGHARRAFRRRTRVPRR